MKMNVAKVDFEMGIVPSQVDKMRNDLILLGHSWREANSMAADAYVLRHAKVERIRKNIAASMPYNTAKPKRPNRPTQTAWRSIHANI